MLALNDSVNGFMLDDAIGEFILTDPDMKIPPRGKVCSKKFHLNTLKAFPNNGLLCISTNKRVFSHAIGWMK